MENTNDLATLLKDLNNGEFHASATTAFTELVAKIKDVERMHGGEPKGKLVVSFDVKHRKGVIEIEAKVAVKEPSSVVGHAIRYASPNGELHKQDPMQRVMELGSGREVRSAAPEVRG